MIIYNKNTKETFDSTTVNDFDAVFFERDPIYPYIKATPQQEADYVKKQSELELICCKQEAINQLQTLKTTTIDKLRVNNFANIVKAIATQNQPAINSIIALDTKLDTIDTELAIAINSINEAINQTMIDNCITTFTEFLI